MRRANEGEEKEKENEKEEEEEKKKEKKKKKCENSRPNHDKINMVQSIKNVDF